MLATCLLGAHAFLGLPSHARRLAPLFDSDRCYYGDVDEDYGESAAEHLMDARMDGHERD